MRGNMSEPGKTEFRPSKLRENERRNFLSSHAKLPLDTPARFYRRGRRNPGYHHHEEDCGTDDLPMYEIATIANDKKDSIKVAE